MSTPDSSDPRAPAPNHRSSGSRRPNRREIAAAATRAEILRAARALFAERGYVQTSMADIADESGVSIPTLYASVGPKAAVVMALYERVNAEVGGDRVGERIARESDPTELIALAVHLNRLLAEGAGDIIGAFRGAAHAEPAIAAILATSERQHRIGSRRIADRLGEIGALRGDIDEAEAADVIALLADDDIVARLVRGYGWSFDRAEEWLTATLRRALLGG
jgi:AcrR family transcriptional regulator